MAKKKIDEDLLREAIRSNPHVVETSAEMARIYHTFAANAPKTDDEACKVDFSVFIKSHPAILLGKYIVEQIPPGDIDLETVFMNGCLYGIMLCELGLGAYILREKSGEAKQ